MHLKIHRFFNRSFATIAAAQLFIQYTGNSSVPPLTIIPNHSPRTKKKKKTPKNKTKDQNTHLEFLLALALLFQAHPFLVFLVVAPLRRL